MPHPANAKCKQKPSCCVQCCKLVGGCTLPGHQAQAALLLPSPSPSAPVLPTSAATLSSLPDVDTASLLLSTIPSPLSLSSTTVSPHATTLSGPTTRSYARPLNEHYAQAYYFEAHAKTSEAEILLKQAAKIQTDLQNVVTVVIWIVVSKIA